MKAEKHKCHKGCAKDEAEKALPGVSQDVADREHVTKREVRQDTARLGNNPRIDEGPGE